MPQLRQAYELLHRMEIAELHLVVQHNITTQTAHLNHSLPPSHRITILPWAVVMMYPLDHDLVPPHRLATPEERAACLPMAGGGPPSPPHPPLDPAAQLPPR